MSNNPKPPSPVAQFLSLLAKAIAIRHLHRVRRRDEKISERKVK